MTAARACGDDALLWFQFTTAPQTVELFALIIARTEFMAR
jgi:hypothetical protein